MQRTTHSSTRKRPTGSAQRTIAARCRRIRMILLDVDGVLTDGGLYYTADGHELKRFHAHDGYGITRGREAGLVFGIISGRSTPIVRSRGSPEIRIVVPSGKSPRTRASSSSSA